MNNFQNVHLPANKLENEYTLVLAVTPEYNRLYMDKTWSLCIVDKNAKCVVKGRDACPLIGAGFLVKSEPSYYNIIGIGSDNLDSLNNLRSAYNFFGEDMLNAAITSSCEQSNKAKHDPKPTQTALQTFAQRQVSLNAKKITELEEELEELRALQKHFKNVRSGKVK